MTSSMNMNEKKSDEERDRLAGEYYVNPVTRWIHFQV
jgi:hypothetical protein